MRGLALCLVSAVLIAGCGGDDDNADVPEAFERPAASTRQDAGVSSGSKARSPAQQCKGRSKKKPSSKGKKARRAQSPHSKCVAEAKKKAKKTREQLAANNGSATGTQDEPADDEPGGAADDGPSASEDGTSTLNCTDANGDPVASDSPDVEECDDGSVGAEDPGSADELDPEE